MKYFRNTPPDGVACPAPHGAGGLKFLMQKKQSKAAKVPPRTGRVD